MWSRASERSFLWVLLFLIVGLFIFNVNVVRTNLNYGHPQKQRTRTNVIQNDGDERHDVTRDQAVYFEMDSEEVTPIYEQETTALVRPTNLAEENTKYFSNADTHENRKRRTQYLIPIKTKTGGGANSQYERFKKAIILAMLTNRTLVLTPFFLHGGHVRGLNPDHLRSFKDTFDVEMLSELLPVATVEEYRKVCNRGNTKAIGWKVDPSDYETTAVDFFGNIMDIELPGADALKSFQIGCQLDEVISELGDATCAAFSTSGYLGLPLGGPEQREEMLRTVMKYLWRSLKIRKVVDIMTEDICHGEQYLAFHWRNKSSEMPCFFGRDKSKDRCESIVREVRKLAHRASDAVSELMEQEHIKCIYVACPLWSLEIVDILAKRIPRNRIIVSKDLPIPESDKAFVEDYYIMSLVEQEVAYRAAIFVAAGYSNWSDFVTEGREVAGKITYDIRELAQIPEEVNKMMI